MKAYCGWLVKCFVYRLHCKSNCPVVVNVWPYNELQYHWLISFNCHLWDYKMFLINLTTVSVNIVSVHISSNTPHNCIAFYHKKSGQLTIAERCALIFKVTQGHWFIQSKTYIHDFLSVINWDLSSLSPSSRYGATKLKTTPPYFETPRSTNPLEYRHQTL